MPQIEILKSPIVQVVGDTTHHIFAIDKAPITAEEASGRALPEAIGAVTVRPALIEHDASASNMPYGLSRATEVQGKVGKEVVYDKTLDIIFPLDVKKPFLGLRTNIAKRRASRAVLKGLKV